MRTLLSRCLPAVAALLGLATGVSAQDVNVKVGVIQVGNELQVQFLPDQNVALPVTASQFTVSWNNPNISLGTAEWMSDPVGGYMQGVPTTFYGGTRQDTVFGGRRYASFTQFNDNGAPNTAWTAGTAVSVLRIPIVNPGNECAVFTMADDALTNASNRSFYMTLGAGTSAQADVQDGTFGFQVAPVVNENTGLGYCTIQSAIDAAQTVNGHTIRVAAGTYEEQVTVSKELSLLGPNANIPGNGSRGAEAIVQFPAGSMSGTNLINVSANNVTIGGLEMRFGNTTISNVHNLIRSTNANDLAIRNNRFQGSEIAIAVRTSNNSTYRSGLVIEGNYIDGADHVNSGFGKGIEVQRTGGVVQDNQVLNVNYGIEYLAAANTNPLTIQRNVISAAQIGMLHNSHARGGAAATWNQNVVSLAPNDRAGQKALVSGALTSEVEFAGFSVLAFGSGFSGTMPSLTVSNNSLDAGFLAGSTYNVISRQGFVSIASAAGSTMTLENNSFTGFADGVINNDSDEWGAANEGSVTATCNWFGSSVVGDVQADVIGNVSFLPYLTNGTDNDGAIGFQPVPNSCTGGPVRVYTDATETTLVSAHFTIQAAIDAATTQNGYVVRVDAGTYDGAILINKALTLFGPNKDVDPTDPLSVRAPEAILTNSGTLWYVVQSTCGVDDVTVAGFKVVQDPSFTGNRAAITLAANNAQVYNVIVDGVFTGFGGIRVAAYCSGAYQSRTGANIHHNLLMDQGLIYMQQAAGTVENNRILAAGTAVQIQPYGNPAAGVVRNNYIETWRTGLYFNYANKGAGTWTFDGNEIRSSTLPTSITGTATWRGVRIQTFGAEGSGAVPEVEFLRNTINGSGVSSLNSYWTDVNGIQIESSAQGVATFSQNFVTDVEHGVNVAANAPLTLTLFENVITGSEFAIRNESTATTVNATCNWFGSANAATVQAAVTGNVTVVPYLIGGTDDDLATRGFQPAAGTCIGQPFTLAATSLNVNCNGAADGSIDLTVTGGVAPFTYAWTNSATTQDLSGLAPATYNVTVTDSLGSTGTLATAITISEPAAVVLSASATPILCFGGTSTLTASATGADSLRVNGVLYTAALSGLTPGEYTVIAYGTNGNNNGVCTDTEVVTITQPAAALSVSTSVTNATCNTNSDGGAVATATGGTAPYGYSWNDGAAQTTATASGLGTGSYTVTVTDANGCTANASATIGQAAHSGSTWYVATTGSNSNNGNAGCPVQTIQFAINSATAGDVVDVAAGTYTEQVTLNKANITLRSADGNATTFIENPIVGSETAGVTAVANMGTLTLDGFTVNNFRNGIIQGMASAAGTTFIVQNNKVIPENNATNPYLRNGIQVTGNGSQVLNNYVVGAPLTSTWASTGIGVVNASNALVEGNTVNTASADIGINVLNYNVDAVNGVTVRNNTVHNAKNGIRLEGGPVATGAPRKLVSNTLIEGNVLTNSPTSSGINAQSVAVEGLTVTGNIITGHTQYAVRFSNTTAVLSGVISINENILTGTIGGLFNGPGYAINATCNWWGSDVPADVLGDILGGGNVTFIPWLLDDSDLSASIGFQPGGACAGYPVTLTARAVLSGAYVTATGLMRDELRTLPAFPTTEPYTALGYTDVVVSGTVPSSVLAVTGNDAIVDWVLVEVRDAATPATVLHRRAALMQRDGDIVDTDGSTPIYVWTLARDNYHVAVRHRNHLGAMTASSQFLGNAPSLIDFRSIATFGTEAQRQLVPGVSGLWEGNTRNNTRIAYTGANNDRDPILLALPAPSPTSVRLDVYNQSDVNLDGDVKYTGANNDRAPILSNIGGNVPTAVRLQQLP